jgi:hypothetical protein
VHALSSRIACETAVYAGARRSCEPSGYANEVLEAGTEMEQAGDEFWRLATRIERTGLALVWHAEWLYTTTL